MKRRPREEEEDEDEEEEAEEEKPKRTIKNDGSVNLYEPLFIWIIILSLAMMLRILAMSTTVLPAGTISYTIAKAYSDFILMPPGIYILPLIMGAVIGAEAGARSSTPGVAARSGILNGIYAAVTYAVVIIIIFLVLNYLTLQPTSVSTIAFQYILIPALIFLVTIEVFAVLSHMRRAD